MLNDLFQYQFLVNALIAVFLSAAGTSLLSVFVTLKKMSFLGEAFSHIAFAGIALALLLGTELTLTTLIFVGVVSLLIGFVSKYYHHQEANIITIFLSLSMAVGIILLNLNRNYVPDVTSYLFGNILLVTRIDLIYLVILLLVNIGFITLFFKELFYLTYNYNVAVIYRIRANLVYYLFTILLAANIVVSVKIIGVILITAQLILPGITALNLTKNIKWAVVLSFMFAQIGALSGFFISYQLNLPSGASIVVIQFIVFVISLVYKEVSSA